MQINNEQNRKNDKILIDTILLGLFLILAPFDTALGSFAGTFLNGLMLIAFFARIFVSIAYPNKNKNYISLYLLFCCVYIIYMTLTSCYGLNPVAKTNFFPIVVAIMIIPYCVRKYNDKELTFLENCLSIVAIVLLIVVIYDKFFHSQENDVNRLYIYLGNYADPNYFSSGICVVILFNVHMFVKKHNWGNGLMALFCVAVVLLTGSRGGLVSMSISIFVYIVFASKRKVLTTSVIIVLGVSIYFAALSILPEYVANRIKIENLFSGTGSGRLIIWKNFYEIFKNGNFFNKIFGFGRGSCQQLYFNYTNGIYYLPHNMYIKTIIEGGILGFVIYAIMFLMLLYKSIKDKNVLAISNIIAFLVAALFLDMDDTRTLWIVVLLVFIPQIYNRKIKYKDTIVVNDLIKEDMINGSK